MKENQPASTMSSIQGPAVTLHRTLRGCRKQEPNAEFVRPLGVRRFHAVFGSAKKKKIKAAVKPPHSKRILFIGGWFLFFGKGEVFDDGGFLEVGHRHLAGSHIDQELFRYGNDQSGR